MRPLSNLSKPLEDSRSAESGAAMLHKVIHGSADNKPLLIVHGLFGSARNWGVIAKRLSDMRQVVAVDLRNHGQSPWSDRHRYTDMASDLAEVITSHGTPMDVLGHSMGGKSAMTLALTRPELVGRLIVADIAPVAYEHDQSQHIKTMRAVNLTQVKKRSDVTAQLAQHIDDPTLQSFFAQSLDFASGRWRLNLDALERDMPAILGFPEFDTIFSNQTLFLSGAESNYVTQTTRTNIKRLFPNAKFAKIPNTGHWLHAEAPREFEASVRAFLTMSFT